MWTDMNPPCGSVLLSGSVLVGKEGESVQFCIDHMANGKYRATVGDLFHSITVCTNHKLENLLIDFQEYLPKIRREQKVA